VTLGQGLPGGARALRIEEFVIRQCLLGIVDLWWIERPEGTSKS
jgi:hypothetical protein